MGQSEAYFDDEEDESEPQVGSTSGSVNNNNNNKSSSMIHRLSTTAGRQRSVRVAEVEHALTRLRDFQVCLPGFIVV